jgi:acyl-coenzyme A thioesterase 9
MSGLRAFPRLTTGLRFCPRITSRRARAFQSYSRCQTDGVYQELTAMRTRLPFIEAFRAQQENETTSQPNKQEISSRDLSPKSMTDSYVKIVSHMINLFHTIVP